MDIVGIVKVAEPVAQLRIAFKGERVLALRPVQRDAGDAVLMSHLKCVTSSRMAAVLVALSVENGIEPRRHRVDVVWRPAVQ